MNIPDENTSAIKLNRCPICNGRLWGFPEYTGDFMCMGHSIPSNNTEPVYSEVDLLKQQLQEKEKEIVELKRSVLAGLKIEVEKENIIKELGRGFDQATTSLVETGKLMSYWQSRCEAAEVIVHRIIDKININHDDYKHWQSLKQQKPITP